MIALALLFLFIPRQAAPPAQHAETVLVQPAPSPHDLTLYNQRGEQVAKCQIVDDGQTIKDCKIQTGYTLDDVFTAWADALKLLESEVPDKGKGQ